jgi:hypothetical protein
MKNDVFKHPSGYSRPLLLSMIERERMKTVHPFHEFNFPFWISLTFVSESTKQEEVHGNGIS